MAHPNEELVRKGFDAFSKGDMETLANQVLDPAITYHVPGRSPVSGDYSGTEQVLGFFANLFQLTNGTFQVQLHDVVAGDEHAVSLFTATGERDGRSLDVRSVIVWHARNDRLTEAWLFTEDQYTTDAFWS